MINYEILVEQLRTLNKLIRIAFILIALKKAELLPTILEVIAMDAQAIIDDHCVEV